MTATRTAKPGTWTIRTDGPCFTFKGTAADATARLHRIAVLKKGWTTEVTALPNNPGLLRLRVLNSKGRLVAGAVAVRA